MSDTCPQPARYACIVSIRILITIQLVTRSFALSDEPLPPGAIVMQRLDQSATEGEGGTHTFVVCYITGR